jgi:hypothetical protein
VHDIGSSQPQSNETGHDFEQSLHYAASWTESGDYAKKIVAKAGEVREAASSREKSERRNVAESRGKGRATEGRFGSRLSQ